MSGEEEEIRRRIAEVWGHGSPAEAVFDALLKQLKPKSTTYLPLYFLCDITSSSAPTEAELVDVIFWLAAPAISLLRLHYEYIDPATEDSITLDPGIVEAARRQNALHLPDGRVIDGPVTKHVYPYFEGTPLLEAVLEQRQDTK